MIEFQHNMLVLNNIFSKEDVEQINAYTEYVRKQERESIVKMLKTNGYDSEHLAAMITMQKLGGIEDNMLVPSKDTK